MFLWENCDVIVHNVNWNSGFYKSLTQLKCNNKLAFEDKIIEAEIKYNYSTLGTHTKHVFNWKPMFCRAQRDNRML